jgi:hypothetical protein
VGIAQRDPSAHRDKLVDEEEPVLEHLLEDQNLAVGLGREGERDRGQVGRERGPGPVLDLRDRVADVGSDPQSLLGRHNHVVVLELRFETEATELAADHDQIAGLGAPHPQLAACRGGKGHEAADLDVVGGNRVLGTAEPVPPMDGHDVRADPVDVRPHLGQHAGEVLDVRLTGSV